jgi:hypothetical protein
MAVTGKSIAHALERANVCSGKQGAVIAASLDEADAADPHAPLHGSVTALWEKVLTLEVEVAKLTEELARRKPGPKPKPAGDPS